ncbi:MAG: hypothetical protein Q8O84_00735, partial [Nanoarchaeota archaeon]|nr:hypothetical protein [Nanoarchaeota archaeon]
VESLGTCGFTFAFSVIFTYPVNWIYWKWLKVQSFKLFAKAILKHGDELERTFLDSLKFKKLLQITLKNNKVYVGIVARVNEPQKTNYVEIFPVMSGYRESESKILHITIPYTKVIEALDKEGKTPILKDFKIVIKQDEILTTTIFYPEIYDKFQEHAKETADHQIAVTNN